MAAGQKFVEFLSALWKDYHGSGLIKWIELFASLYCLYLHSQPPVYQYHTGNTPQQCPNHTIYRMHANFLSMTFGGFIIVQAGIVISYATKEPISKRIELIYSLIGTAVFLASGCMAMSKYNEGTLETYQLTIGIIAIANSVVFLIDASLSMGTKDVYVYVQQNGPALKAKDKRAIHFTPTAPSQENNQEFRDSETYGAYGLR